VLSTYGKYHFFFLDFVGLGTLDCGSRLNFSGFGKKLFFVEFKSTSSLSTITFKGMTYCSLPLRDEAKGYALVTEADFEGGLLISISAGLHLCFLGDPSDPRVLRKTDRLLMIELMGDTFGIGDRNKVGI
jgi:hypothetical protein